MRFLTVLSLILRPLHFVRHLFIAPSRLAAGILAVGALGVACTKNDIPVVVVPPPDVGTVSVNEPPQPIERGAHFTFTATVKSKTGTTLLIPVVWRSSNESVATVDATGRVTAIDTGNAVIIASTINVNSAGTPIKVYQDVGRVDQFQFTPLAANSPGTSADSIRVQIRGLDTSTVIVGKKVKFTVTAGGGTVAPAVVTTNLFGMASAAWTLGPAAGVNTVTATVLNSEDAPVTYVTPNSTSFTIRTFNAIVPVTGNNQEGTILSVLPVHPAVKLVDSLNKPRAGIPVRFSVSSGGKLASTVVSTGADGVASPGAWTLGNTPGEQTLVAKVENAQVVLKATGTGTPVYYSPKTIAAGLFVTCAIETDSTVSCFGEQPKVGDSTLVNRTSPTPTKNGFAFNSLVTGISDLFSHNCGVAVDQSIYCWGSQSLTDTAAVPKVINAPNPTRYPSDLLWKQIAPGQQHNCALATDQAVYCWGFNNAGQLGDRTNVRHGIAAPVFGGFKFQSVTSGANHTCALALDGAAFCWGLNQNGQLGSGTTQDASSPTAVTSGLVFKEISAGQAFTCAITTAGRPFCWGQLGLTAGNTAVVTPRTYVDAPNFTTITSGGQHSCALTADGSAYCWGDNSVGQLGDSTQVTHQNPTAVATTMKFRSISAGNAHTCGIGTNGAVLCWGFNKSGELGDADLSTIRTQPRFIVLSVNP